MPLYEYGCNSCGLVTEILHGIKEELELVCPCGSSDIRQLISSCSFSIRNTRAVNKVLDRKKADWDMTQELKEDHGIHSFKPIGKNGVADVHADVKSQGDFVKDKMQEEAEKNSARTKLKQKEWMGKAMKRAPARSKEIVERKKKKAAEDGKITITSV